MQVFECLVKTKNAQADSVCHGDSFLGLDMVRLKANTPKEAENIAIRMLKRNSDGRDGTYRVVVQVKWGGNLKLVPKDLDGTKKNAWKAMASYYRHRMASETGTYPSASRIRKALFLSRLVLGRRTFNLPGER